MRFIDEVTIHTAGGNGGDGAIHWRREKFAPRGGPDGGDGGSGGAIIFTTDTGLSTLLDLAYSPHMRAEHGVPGGENGKNGRDGRDFICRVPVGTQIFYEEQLVADLSVAGARWVAARGGKGGKGNTFFATSTNQSPDYAQPGQPGEEFTFRLVLKSVADVGLVGFPNVGKSTLIACISEAKPKIADYEFTTLQPNLGVVTVGEGDSPYRYVVADIPGLIPDAHLGKGLGIQFLKHIERTRGIAFVIDLFRGEESQTFLERAKFQYEALETELGAFSNELKALPRTIILTKADLGLYAENSAEVFQYFQGLGLGAVLASGVTGAGAAAVKEALAGLGRKLD